MINKISYILKNAMKLQMGKSLFQKIAVVIFLIMLAIITLSTRYQIIAVDNTYMDVVRLDKWTGKACALPIDIGQVIYFIEEGKFPSSFACDE